ncbi:MAG: hypothetical protein RR630_07110 [Coprobacillus sp.]
MGKTKIKNKFFWVSMIFLALMTIFILIHQYYYPQREGLYYQKDLTGNKVYFEDKALIYNKKTDEFVGYKFKGTPLKNYPVTLSTDVLVSKKEHLNYFEQTEYTYNIATEYQKNNLHIQIGETGKSFMNPSYHMLLSVYHNGYYIQSVVYYLEEDIDIENENEIVTLAKIYCEKLLSYYNENKNDFRSIIKNAENNDFKEKVN